MKCLSTFKKEKKEDTLLDLRNRSDFPQCFVFRNNRMFLSPVCIVFRLRFSNSERILLFVFVFSV